MKNYLIKYTLKAEKDIDEIFSFIALDNIGEAKNHIKKIITSIEKLKSFPESGKEVSKKLYKKEKIRVLLCENVRVFYKIDNKNKLIQILHVVKDSRDLEKIIF